MSPSPLPRDLSEHIPLIVTTNICVTTLLCRCNNKYLDIIWKLHCYNLSVLLQQLCVEIILLQLLNVVTVFITTYSLNVVTMEYFIVTITITSFTHAPRLTIRLVLDLFLMVRRVWQPLWSGCKIFEGPPLTENSLNLTENN